MKNRTCRVAWIMIGLALTALQSLAQSTYEPYTFSTLARLATAPSGSADGTGSAARFDLPACAIDSYLAKSLLIGQITFEQSSRTRMTMTRPSNCLNRRQRLAPVPRTANRRVIAWDCAHDAVMRRTRAALKGTAATRFGESWGGAAAGRTWL